MRTYNVTILGGGSAYTPGLIEGLLRFRDEFAIRRLVLMDIDEHKLSVVGTLVTQMLKTQVPEIEVVTTGDRRAALEGADFVLCQIRVGGLQARHLDESIPLAHQVLGQETTGPGGFSMALRTIPVMVEVARDIMEIAPEAWLINYTNPTGIVAEAVHRVSPVKMLSICDVPMGMQFFIAKIMGVPTREIRLDYVGLNHLGWIRRVWLKGQDILPQLRQMIDSVDLDNLPPGLAVDDPHAMEEAGSVLRLFKELDVIPSYYLQYYYYNDEMVGKLVRKGKTRAQEVMEIEQDLLPYYQEVAAQNQPSLWKKRGGDWHAEMMVGLVSSIANDKQDLSIVNVPNRGTVTGIPDDKVVEVTALIDRSGAHPLTVGRIPLDMLGLMQVVGAYETLTVEAALEGSYAKALRALALHPLVPSLTVARKILDEYFKAHADLLPQFRK